MIGKNIAMWTHFCTWMPRSHTHTKLNASSTVLYRKNMDKKKFSTTKKKKKTYFQRSQNKQWIIVRCLRNLWLCLTTKQIISSLCLKLWINYYSSSTEPSEEQINIQTHRFKSSPGKKKKRKRVHICNNAMPYKFFHCPFWIFLRTYCIRNSYKL